MQSLSEDIGLEIGPYRFHSRLVLGTAGYVSDAMLLRALKASGTELVTVALRRLDVDASRDGGLLELLLEEGYALLPNTAGCYTAKDAILTAELAREALGTDLLKLEVIGDDETLLPDGEELLKAARVLVREGFYVMAYSNDDPILCRKLQDSGCAAVMPLGSPIGSGMGIRNPYNFRIIRETLQIPMLVDAGLGTASEAALAMELGCDGVLLNTAISGAEHPVLMAEAFRLGVDAGRAARLAGRIPRRLYAKASSPTEGMLQTE